MNLFAMLRCMPCPRRFSSFLPWLLPSGWGSSRHFRVLFPLWVPMPVSPIFRNSWPSLSRLLAPSLALSWSGRCRILRQAWTMTCCFALFVPSASISAGLCPWLRVAAAFSSLRAAPRAPCLRMRSPFSCVRSFMGLRWPVLRWVRSVPMTFMVSLPQWRSTVTGRSPRCLTLPPGAPVRCLPLFTCVTFNMSFRVLARWVRSWLRVRGSRSPHLLPICCGGGGGSMSPLSPGSASVAGCGGLPFQLLFRSWGIPFLCFYFFFIEFILFMFLFFIVLCVSQPKMSRGVVLYGHMT